MTKETGTRRKPFPFKSKKNFKVRTEKSGRKKNTREELEGRTIKLAVLHNHKNFEEQTQMQQKIHTTSPSSGLTSL
jgi:hypothetical protein